MGLRLFVRCGIDTPILRVSDMPSRAHWEQVYATRRADEVSWYQPIPTRSLALLAEAGLTPDSRIIDVGGGDSTLVDALLDRGVRHVTVLDISGAALARAQARLGPRAGTVTWIAADATAAELPPASFDFWHDRAVFHFLTDADARAAYVERARRAIRPGGTLIVSAFASDGPTRCSGLEVARYEPESVAGEFGEDFELVRGLKDSHRTPSGAEQRFIYAVLRRRSDAG